MYYSQKAKTTIGKFAKSRRFSVLPNDRLENLAMLVNSALIKIALWKSTLLTVTCILPQSSEVLRPMSRIFLLNPKLVHSTQLQVSSTILRNRQGVWLYAATPMLNLSFQRTLSTSELECQCIVFTHLYQKVKRSGGATAAYNFLFYRTCPQVTSPQWFWIDIPVLLWHVPDWRNLVASEKKLGHSMAFYI